MSKTAEAESNRDSCLVLTQKLRGLLYEVSFDRPGRLAIVLWDVPTTFSIGCYGLLCLSILSGRVRRQGNGDSIQVPARSSTTMIQLLTIFALILSFIKSFSHAIPHISVETSRLYDLRRALELYFPDQPSSCPICQLN